MRVGVVVFRDRATQVRRFLVSHVPLCTLIFVDSLIHFMSDSFAFLSTGRIQGRAVYSTVKVIRSELVQSRWLYVSDMLCRSLCFAQECKEFRICLLSFLFGALWR